MLGDSRRAFARVFRSRDLRRAQLSSGAAWTSELAFTTALGVYAFADGGAAAVGIVGFARVLPAAAVLPFLGAVGDRVPRERLLLISCAARTAATVLATIAVALAAPALVVYALAVLATVAFTVFRPAHSALLPSLCNAPEDLTSANVVRSVLDAASALVGPIVAGVLLATASVEAAFAAVAALSLCSAIAIARVRCERSPLATVGTGGVGAAAVEGARALLAERRAALLVAMGAAQALTRGALTVFAVVIAIDVIETGEGGVGALWAAFGAGGLVGALATSILLGHRRLAAFFGAGIALWGAPLALLGALPSEPAALALLAVVGVANAFVDVTIFTLLQRLVPDDVLARVLGIAEMGWTIALAAGSLAAPLLITLLGTEGALVAAGAALPVIVLAAWPALRRIDSEVAVRDEEIGLLRGVPMLRPLAVPVVEQLARLAQPAHVPAGETIFEAGDVGDSFYVIAEGEAAVDSARRRLRTLGPGDSFGEIALLRTARRTATVRALTDLELRALDGASFVTCVTGSPACAREADSVVDARLEFPDSGVRVWLTPGSRPG